MRTPRPHWYKKAGTRRLTTVKLSLYVVSLVNPTLNTGFKNEGKSPVRRRAFGQVRTPKRFPHFPFCASHCHHYPQVGYLPASLSSLANGTSRLIEKQQEQKQKHNYFLCPFFLSDFYCQDHGREKALLFICYVLLSTYYVAGTRGTMINKTDVPFTESFRSVH